MLLEIFSFVKEIFSPAAKLIDDVHTSDEERAGLRNELAKIEAATTAKIMDYEGKLLDARSNIIMAETNSDSWLVKNWRPMMMMMFGSIVVSYWLGYQPVNMSAETLEDVFDLIKLGLGGYVLGRSGEKIAKVMKK